MWIARGLTPDPRVRAIIVGMEPWQREAVNFVHNRFGIDEDALLRAGLTMLLAFIAAAERPPEFMPPAPETNTTTDEVRPNAQSR